MSCHDLVPYKFDIDDLQTQLMYYISTDNIIILILIYDTIKIKNIF